MYLEDFSEQACHGPVDERFFVESGEGRGPICFAFSITIVSALAFILSD